MPSPQPYFGQLLKRVHLGGLINEAVIHFTDNGLCYVQAIDMSNSLLVDIAMQTDFPDLGDLGIGNISILEKFFSSNLDVAIQITREENRLLLNAGTHGKFKYLLSQPELIPTETDDPDSMNRFISETAFRIPLTEIIVRDISNYLSWCKPATILIEVDIDNSIIIVKGGQDSEHQYDVSLGTYEQLVVGNVTGFSTSVYGSHFAAVLNVLEWSESEQPMLYIVQTLPVIITTNDNNFWALTPAQ